MAFFLAEGFEFYTLRRSMTKDRILSVVERARAGRTKLEIENAMGSHSYSHIAKLVNELVLEGKLVTVGSRGRAEIFARPTAPLRVIEASPKELANAA